MEAWSEEVAAFDLESLSLLIESTEEPPPPTSIRLGSEPRWVEVRRISLEEGCLLVFTDRSARVEANRRSQKQARRRRLVTDLTEAIASTDELDDTTPELLAGLGDHLELTSATWCSRPDEQEHWETVARWSIDPETRSAFDPALVAPIEARLSGALPVIRDMDGRPHLDVPILVFGRCEHVLHLEPIGETAWDPEMVDLMQRLADQLGRRLEEQTSARERESWAVTRGALERSEALAQVTSGVAHDFNGLLFAMLGRFELLRLKISDPAALEQLDELERTIHEAKRTADRLRKALTGGDTADLPITIQPELAAITDTLTRLLPSRVDFHAVVALPETPLEISARANTLQQIALNLAANARNAVSAHGRIQLGARLLADGRFELRVDDDGPGIPEADRERVTEPFETGDQSDGVGLGLAICRRLTTEAGGEFRLEESPLGGLAARAIFPVESDRVRGFAERQAPRTDPRNVIVVEDNDIIRDVLVRVFEGVGATVHASRDALGLEDLLKSRDDVDLLVIDIDLPHRTGVAAVTDLRESGDDTPCLLITGGTSTPPDLPGVGFLRKPFKIDVLREAARRLITTGG